MSKHRNTADNKSIRNDDIEKIMEKKNMLQSLKSLLDFWLFSLMWDLYLFFIYLINYL